MLNRNRNGGKGLVWNVDIKLENGTFWPIPVTLSVSETEANLLNTGNEVALIEDETQAEMPILTISEIYEPNKTLECEKIYGTTDKAHPGVAKIITQKKFN